MQAKVFHRSAISFLCILFIAVLFINGGSGVEKKTNQIETEYLPDELLIKFEDDFDIDLRQKRSGVFINISSVNELFERSGVISGRQLFYGNKKRNDATEKIPQLCNFYSIKFLDNQDIENLAEVFSNDPSIEFAEPNFIFHITDTYPDDPLYQDGSQWYIDAVNAPSAWDSVSSDTNQIIAVLDTGVDWDHPDLDDNIWTNWDEIPGNGNDDDGNGYADDIRGWDWINNDNDPNDDNSHGTHVAGIAAAETNNGTGISGIAWGARIMPLKVLQSSGRGSAGDIAAGIYYAYINGATVINMSFGSYSPSQTIKSVLENAYSSSVLVAAAGNDHYPISFLKMYPAGYQFVLGVQSFSPGGGKSGFSNYDTDPTSTDIYDAGLNYEIYAPGENILSTFPFGAYNNLNGTSMSAPIVSGAVALLKTYEPLMSTEEIFARFIQGSSSGNLDIYNSLTMELLPVIQFNEYTIKDTMPDCNNDGTVDDGETITLSFEIENVGGWADSLYAKIELTNLSDTVYAEILDSTAYIGDLGIYSSLNTDNDPFIIHIDTTTPYKQEIELNIIIQGKNTIGINSGISFEVTNAYEIKGILDSIMTLTPGILWVVDGGFMMDPGGGFEFLPGAHFINVSGFSHTDGVFFGNGTPDSMILIEGKLGYGTANFAYAHFLYGGYSQGSGSFYNCIFENPHRQFRGNNCNYTDCRFINGHYEGMTSTGTLTRCNFYNLSGNITQNWTGNLNYHYCNFLGVDKSSPFFYHAHPSGLIENNFICKDETVIYGTPGSTLILEVPNQYWGTTDHEKIDERVWDFYENPGAAILRYEPVLIRPSDSAHGVIWKVEINDVNPHDEFLAPLGSGCVKFDVYFNKCVDTANTPLLTFGNYEPYDEHIVNDSASWSADSSMWTAWYNIGLETGDGINVIKVSGAVDTAGWDIYPEFNNRFKFVIQAASSASIDFEAIGGLDHISLEWPGAYTNDVLGYNLYRMTRINDTTFSDSLLVNTNLITDTVFVDETVIAGTTYYYFYKVVGTDLLENDRSKIVNAASYVAQEGDANGDLAVDVLDITTVVSYILQQNPQPFYDYAADVNNDQEVNIIDIVGIIQLISGTQPLQADMNLMERSVSCMDSFGSSITLNNQDELIAIQFEAVTSSKIPEHLKMSTKGYEFSYSYDRERLTGLIYNYKLRQLPPGLNELIHLSGNREIKIINAFGITDHLEIIDLINDNDHTFSNVKKTFSIYPNPVREQASIHFTLDHPGMIQILLFNTNGKYINTLITEYYLEGNHLTQWKMESDEARIPLGVYYCRFKFIPEGGIGKPIEELQKIIILN